MGNWRQETGDRRQETRWWCWCNTCPHVSVVVGKINPQGQRKQIVQAKPCVVHKLMFPSPCLERCSSFSTELLLVHSFRQHSQPRTRCCQAPYLLLCLSPCLRQAVRIRSAKTRVWQASDKSGLGWSRRGAHGVHIHSAQVGWVSPNVDHHCSYFIV